MKLTDVCKKCGRELGEHDGRKCPKPAKSKPTKPTAKIGGKRFTLEQIERDLVCCNPVRDPSTGKPYKGVHARTCERELGHEGVHRIGPHGEFEHVTEWDDARPGCVSYNLKFHRPGKTTTAKSKKSKHPPVVRGPQLALPKTMKKPPAAIATEVKLAAQVAAGWSPGTYGAPEPGRCKECEGAIPPTKFRSGEAFGGRGKPRAFCDAKCRKRYSRKHPKGDN